MLNKKTLIILFVVIVIALAFFYPKSFSYVNSGKGDAMNYREESSCFGIKNVYQPQCSDCLQVTNCYGLLYNNKCYSRELGSGDSPWNPTTCR